MPREFCRLLFATWTIPFSAGVYVAVKSYAYDRISWTSEWNSALFAGIAGWIVLALSLVLAFWGMVRPTVRRVIWTIGSALVLCTAATGAFISVMMVTYDEDLAFMVPLHASWLVPLAWMASLLLIWRETRTERAARLAGPAIYRVACPACGYNMGAQSLARCPECGRDYTIAELLVLQPGRSFESHAELLGLDHPRSASTANVDGSESRPS